MVLVPVGARGALFHLRSATAGDGQQGLPLARTVRSVAARVTSGESVIDGQDAGDPFPEQEDCEASAGARSVNSPSTTGVGGLSAVPSEGGAFREAEPVMSASRDGAPTTVHGSRVADLSQPRDVQRTCLQASFGRVGAAAGLVQSIAIAECLRRGLLPQIPVLSVPLEGPLGPVLSAMPTNARSALVLSGGAPGLAAAVRVEI